MPMKKVIIQGKTTSLNRAKNAVRQVYGPKSFNAQYMHGEVHMYFPDEISENKVKKIARVLKLKVVKLENRAVLDVK